MNINELTCISDINIDEYIKYREEVKSNMPYPEWLGDFTKDDLIDLLNNGSKIWMYYQEDNFVCSMMSIPATEKSLSKFDIDLDYKSVVDYGPMFVNHKYQGNGLQYSMLKEIDNYSIQNGYRYAISTIHPDNIYSIRNLEKDNFIYKGTKEFKRGIRNIYLKELR